MSASEAAAAIPPEDRAGGRSEVGAQDLAQGLMLVRASTINMVRLQLAMERRDRRVALQALDELTLLDRRIGDFIDDLPVDSDDVWADARRLEHQHRALAAEKLVLAAGTSGPSVTPISNQWIDQPPAAPAVEAGPAAAEETSAEPSARDLSPHLIAAVLLLLILAGAAAFLFLTDTGQALIASPAPIEGAS